MRNLGEAIQCGLKRKEQNQKWLAEKMGRYPSAISDWISNKKCPRAIELLTLIEILDLVPELFPDYGKIKNLSEKNVNSQKIPDQEKPKDKTQELERRLAHLEEILSQHGIIKTGV